MTYFPNTIIEIWNYSPGEIDQYGPKIIYTHTGDLKVDMQSMNHNDNQTSSGRLEGDQYKIYTNLDAPISSTSILRIKGETPTYSVIGSPERNNHLLPHLKVQIQLQQTPTQLTEA